MATNTIRGKGQQEPLPADGDKKVLPGQVGWCCKAAAHWATIR